MVLSCERISNVFLTSRSAAKDNHSDQRVAIKKIAKAFENLKDTKRILREIKLLRHFSHENVRVESYRC